ncbi:serine hydrolase [Pseudonocardia nematodicida]|uniref:Serine hydrolase n=1 Tax=Pseudonocardia nematodicida TaxID=1206997 RepID=A0ABV1KFF1_9PSEU
MARRVVWIPAVTAVALLVFLLAMGGWDARYVTRVLWHRGSDVSDVEWKAHVAVAPAAPRPWPTGDCPVTDPPTGNAQSLVIVHGGRMVCQWYGPDSGPERPAPAFSVSKTVLALLISRAVEDGELSGLDLSLGEAVPELTQRDPRFADITLADLVDMRSGITFSESVPFPWVNQDQAAVYYATDLRRTVVERPQVTSTPGPFTYNDYAPNLTGLAYERTTGALVTDAPLEGLWRDLGAQDPVLWCVDDQGFPYHESGLVVTARDLARIGQLVLDDGDDPFVARSLTPSGAATTLGPIDVGYRNGWWVLPGGDLAAMGAHGQIMVVSPTTDTVVVRMGADEGPNIELATRLQALAHRFPT